MTSGSWGVWTEWCGRRRSRGGFIGRGSGIPRTCCSTRSARGSRWRSWVLMGWRIPSGERLGARAAASWPRAGGSLGGWTPPGRMGGGCSWRSGVRCCRVESWNHPGGFPASSRATWSASRRSRPGRRIGRYPQKAAWAGREPSRTGAGRNWSCAWNSQARFPPRGGASWRPRGAVNPNGGFRPLRKTAAAVRRASRPHGRVPVLRPARVGT